MSKPSTAMQLLEKHFDTAFAASDGIKKLRELILTLAMQGKLVPQNTNDQPARELLKEIEAEKKRLVKEGKIKAPKSLPTIKPDEIPYELPTEWEWVRIQECYYPIGSRYNQIQTKDYRDSGLFPVVDQGKSFIAGFCDDEAKVLKIHTPVIVFGDHTKNLKYVDFDFIIGADGVKILNPYKFIDSRFLYYVIKSYDLADRGYARHFKVLNEKLVPIPPLSEQRRIVAKIDQLMARCDELEKLRADHDQKRIAAHTAALNRLLTATESETFSEMWDFITHNFSELYSVKENVTELRKAILQLAVMGKLVPQDSKDQPASELLKEIEAAKNRLVKVGEIKASKPLPAIKPEEVPYELPIGWEWVRLNEALDVRDGTHDTPKYVDIGYPLITSKNLYSGELSFDDIKYISEQDHTKISERSKVDLGDILFAMIGSIGNPALVKSNEEFSIKNVALFKFYMPNKPDNRYLHYFLTHAQENMKAKSSGAVQSFVSLGYLRNYLCPLPPLTEQRRIVAKIDQLMALCDELEKQIDAATGKQTSLLNAVMAQV